MDSAPRATNQFLIGYNLLYLGFNYLWISLESLILPTQIGTIVSTRQIGFVLGITASIGNAFGILGNLAAGILSDRRKSGAANRFPYIIAGIAVVIVTLVAEPITSKSYIGILVGYILLQTFSNMAIGATQPILAEIESKDQRGTSAGLNGLFSLVGTGIGFALTSVLISSNFPNSDFYAIAAGVAVTGVGTLLAIHGNRVAAVSSPLRQVNISLTKLKRIPINLRKFTKLIAGSFFVFSGVTGLTYFELYFFKEVLNFSNPAIYVGIAGIVVIIVSAASAMVLGHFSNRLGRWNIIIVDAAVAAIPTLIIPYFRSFYIFLILGSVIGATYGTFYSVSFAVASDLVPQGESGKYMSFFYLSLAGASSFSPLIYGSVLLLFGQSASSGFVALFTLSGIFYLIGALVLYWAHQTG
jgi:MFS family permease